MELVPYDAAVRNNSVDEFITPPKLVEAAVGLLGTCFDKQATFEALDPGANLGQWGTVLKEVYPQCTVTGVELMTIGKPGAFTHWHNTNFLTWDTEHKYELILGNPPYSKPLKNIAELFVRKSYALLKPGGVLMFLLRTNFVNAKKRSRGLFKEIPLAKIYFTDRPSFYNHDPRTEQFGTKKTNLHDYSIFVWRKDISVVPTFEWLLWND